MHSRRGDAAVWRRSVGQLLLRGRRGEVASDAVYTIVLFDCGGDGGCVIMGVEEGAKASRRGI